MHLKDLEPPECETNSGSMSLEPAMCYKIALSGWSKDTNPIPTKLQETGRTPLLAGRAELCSHYL
jgi:hypothetical protein